MSFSVALGLAGLAANLVGVVLLFRYGMPYRIHSEGGDYIVTGQSSSESLKQDAVYRRLGFLGLTLVVVGAILQAVSLILSG